MTEMTPDLYKAILAMDSYNRGYGAAIPFGAGLTGADQGYMAFQFYNAVAESLNGNMLIDPRVVNILLTGHSLGGGLAGYVGVNDNTHRKRRENDYQRLHCA